MSISLRIPTKDEYYNITKIVNSWNEIYRSIFSDKEFKKRWYWNETTKSLINWENNRKYICAYNDSQMVWYASYRLKNSQTVRVSSIYTTPSYQKKWIWSALLNYIENVAKKEGALVVALETDKNAYWTKSFYENSGYQILSDNNLWKYPYNKVLESPQVKWRYIFWKMI